MGEETVVVVESPAKAQKVRKFLGGRCTVLPTKGHVRELARRAGGGVDPDAAFRMSWTELDKAREPLRAIRAALEGGASRLLLATDPDREGEGISWHLQEVLAGEGALEGVEVRRVAFSEVTPAAVRGAVAAPRDVDHELVNAYLARTALDYLVGFTLSPMLWRKLPCARSAGRVQSVALRLVAEREQDIEAFQKAEYWDVVANLRSATTGGVEAPSSFCCFDARLTHLGGERLQKLSLASGADAEAARLRVEAAALEVARVDRREVRKHPAAPFKTSTLQRAASGALGFSAHRTMSLAQELYEGRGAGEGLITYMRTDGVFIAREAQLEARAFVAEEFGGDYLPDAARQYAHRKRAGGGTENVKPQEAHEAIRPTSLRRLPSELPGAVGSDAKRLYGLIWERALASQMASAVYEQVSVDVADAGDTVRLRGAESRLIFPGFMRLRESRAMQGLASGVQASASSAPSGVTAAGAGSPSDLERLATGQQCSVKEVSTAQHFTAPPPRFTDGSLVTALEERGIGRPSTYANIIKILVGRGYVRREGRSFHLESQGRVLTSFLCQYFAKYVDYDFTSEMETSLDRVSEGGLEREQLLQDFWQPFKAEVDRHGDLSVKDVQEILDGVLGPYLFPASAEAGRGEDPALRQCGQCKGGSLGLRLSRNGAFLGCSNYDKGGGDGGCNAILPLNAFVRLHAEDGAGKRPGDGGSAAAAAQGAKETAALPRDLGFDAASGLPVSVRMGPYGPYLQLGESKEENGFKRVQLKGRPAAEVTLAEALADLEFPKLLGGHPRDGEDVMVKKGRYGPYVEHAGVAASLGETPPGEVGLEAAVTLLEEKGRPLRRRTRGSKTGAAKGKGKGKAKATRKARAMTGYNLFCKEAWQEMKAAQGDAPPFAEATKQISARWKALDPVGQAEFNDRAQAHNSESTKSGPG